MKNKIFFNTIKTIILVSLILYPACKSKKKEDKDIKDPPKATQTIKSPVLQTPSSKKPEKTKKPLKIEEKAVKTEEKQEKQPEKQEQESIKEVNKEPEIKPSAIAAPAIDIKLDEKDKIKAIKQSQPIPFTPKIISANSNINVIFDASGSQSALFQNQALTKIDLQKKALADVILSLKGSDLKTNIGIRVFGSEKTLEENDCLDTKQIYPVSEPNLDKIKEVLAKIQAKGETPLKLALEEAQKDLPKQITTDQMIVLITDGADTCEQDPCELAEKLYKDNPKLSIHVIGFDVNQDDEEKLRCIAKKADGKFYLARNENELRKSLDEAIHSKVPYNLRLSTVTGATPIPTTITIYKSENNKLIKTEQSFGTKLINLEPGTYDVKVEYTSSFEIEKPSKIIKGVEILKNTKVEQEINFDLIPVTFSAIDSGGKTTEAIYKIKKSGTEEVVAEVKGTKESLKIFLTPGEYDIAVRSSNKLTEKLLLSENGLKLETGTSLEKEFYFQDGKLTIKGITTQKKALPFIFQIYKAGEKTLFATGASSEEGTTINLNPGFYDLIVTGQDTEMILNPRTKVTNLSVRAKETTEINATFEMGLLKLYAFDAKGDPIVAEFEIIALPEKEKLAVVKIKDKTKPLELPIPPGEYNILASKPTDIDPRPSVEINNIKITANEPYEQPVQFNFGTIRLRGRNAKEQAIETEFSIFKSGTDILVTKAKPTSEWIIFDLPQGIYDIKADNAAIEDKNSSYLWIKDINVKTAEQVSHEAIFTAGRLKIIGRGANNKIIPCNFKIFEYGSDRELINGGTKDDWQTFEIQPGSYYIEASFTDPDASVLLKKWINIEVDENETLELVLNF